MTFANDFVFSRGTGKTRVNRAGLIVGVDFSATSNTIATGPKTFALAADANVNRDWAVGSNVIAVAQGGEGSMTGTVISYTPSTQSLVLNIASVTGTGTSTNWRIGSLEVTRDVVTGAAESHAAATNLYTFSEEFENAVWIKNNGALLSNVAISPNGSMNADKYVPDTTTNAHNVRRSVTWQAGTFYTRYQLIKPDGYDNVQLVLPGVAFGENLSVDFDLTQRTVINKSSGVVEGDLIPLSNGWFIVFISATAISNAVGQDVVGPLVGGTSSFLGDGVSGILLGGAMLSEGTRTPYIPTTTAQVTRAADSFALSASAIARLGSSGSIYAEVETADVGPAQKRAIKLSGPSLDIRLAKRGVGNFSGFSKSLEVDDVLYFGTVAGNSQRDTGREITSFQAAINERTGMPETVGAVNAWAYDGVSNIGYSAATNEERILTKDLALWSGKGFGGNQINGGFWTGTRFIFSGSVLGIAYISTDGLTLRRVNTPVLNQQTNEVTGADLGGGVYRVVMVGNGGSIFSSDDQGETWTPRTSGVANTLTGAVFGGGLFVISRAATAQNILTSPNGIDWTIRTTAVAQNQNDVAYNGTNLFVSVGTGGTIQTSPNGTTWTAQTSGTTQQLNGVFFANGLWVAVGANGTIVTSPNGTTWTVQSSGITQVLNEVSYFNSLFIAVGGVGTVLTSPNGVTWTLRTVPFTSTVTGISQNSSRVVIAGNGGLISTSEDGLSYASRTNNGQSLNGIAYGNGLFVSAGAVANGSGYIATIDGAGNYTRRVSNHIGSIQNIRLINGVFYAAGQINTVLKSSDAIAWSALTFTGTPRTCFDFATDGTNLIVTQSNSSYSISTDGGLTFGPQRAAVLQAGGGNILGIGFKNGIWVIVIQNGTTGGSIHTTTDPTNVNGWTLRFFGTRPFRSIVFSERDQLWYAVGDAGLMLISPDAINWQPVQNAALGAVNNGVVQASSTLGQFRPGLNRLAISYKNGEVITSMNGASKVDSIASIPAITAGLLGENLNGSIKRLKVQGEALSEVELNAMTGV